MSRRTFSSLHLIPVSYNWVGGSLTPSAGTMLKLFSLARVISGLQIVSKIQRRRGKIICYTSCSKCFRRKITFEISLIILIVLLFLLFALIFESIYCDWTRSTEVDSQLQNINSEASLRYIEPPTSEELKRFVIFLIVELWKKILLIWLDSFFLKVGEDIQLPLSFTINDAKASLV